MAFISSLLTSPEFMPHGFCYLWDRDLIWLHVVSDVLIALAYFSIPLTLVYFVRKKRDPPFPLDVPDVRAFYRGLRQHARDRSMEFMAR